MVQGVYAGKEIVKWIAGIYKKIINFKSNFPLIEYKCQTDDSDSVPIADLVHKSQDPLSTVHPKTDSGNLPILFIFPRGPHLDLSIDPDSAKAQAILSLRGIPHVIVETINEDMSPTGRLPFLINADGSSIWCIKDIEANILFGNGASPSTNKDTVSYDPVPLVHLLNSHLGIELVGEIYSKYPFISHILTPLELFEEWRNDSIFSKHVLSSYRSHARFPKGTIAAHHQRRVMLNYFDKKTTYPSLSAQKLFDNAREAINAITMMLEKSAYIAGGETISEADIVAFAYIYILDAYFLSDGSSPLNTLIAGSTTIDKYLGRMYNLYRQESAKCIYAPSSLLPSLKRDYIPKTSSRSGLTLLPADTPHS